MKLKTFKIHEKGLKRFFGPLEAEIMLIVWNENNVTIKKVQNLLGGKKAIHFSTIMTVMNRLVQKEILQKETQGKAFVYICRFTKEEFFEIQLKQLVYELVDEFGSKVIYHTLAKLQEVDIHLVKKLEQKVKEVKESRV
ncbi:BlaI/MecI/CopY family transcriptional regulator [Priestia megaterium]|uniref:BlaI/MecI/CopY family transcriptional regulator n=1 Tax=Priestia megaterium TaxID=1404 RepID=UPI001F456CD7|nr:BlaI/MecI/CopY family transcriptional regulator [Priestia megaterium]MCF8890618.1 BlaI/MecI/CopY family transcriptional regulator [Priestia megaterium]